jgi:uncharacterized protein DUF4956
MNELVDLGLIYSDQDISNILIELVWVLGLSYFVRAYYIHYAAPASGMSTMGNIIPLLSVITFLVIMVVKTSLALSLGLVGALSIVRFRAPIKDPMELTFIFLAIAIGLGVGAGKENITALVTATVILSDMIRIYFTRKNLSEHTILIKSPITENPESELNSLINILKTSNQVIRISRFEMSDSHLTFVALIELDSLDDIHSITNKLREINQKITCSIFDSQTIW